MSSQARSRSRIYFITGFVVLILLSLVLELRYSKSRPNEFWLAVSPYDPASEAPSNPHSANASVDKSKPQNSDRPAGKGEAPSSPVVHQFKDAPFCFEISADGEAKRSEACERNHHISNQTKHMPICGWQNLKKAAWDPEVIRSSPKILARNLITLSRNVGCRTIILDFENITGELTNQFTPKITELIKELKEMDEVERQRIKAQISNAKDSDSAISSALDKPIVVSVAVYAKTHARGEWDGPRGQDWKQICAVADEITIMAYDYAVPGHGTMTETAPLPWVKSVLEFARGQCETEQIRLGLAAFGYNWQTGQVISERDYQRMLVHPTDAVIVETARERQLKIDLASSLGIHKFLIWSKGQMAD